MVGRRRRREGEAEDTLGLLPDYCPRLREWRKRFRVGLRVDVYNPWVRGRRFTTVITRISDHSGFITTASGCMFNQYGYAAGSESQPYDRLDPVAGTDAYFRVYEPERLQGKGRSGRGRGN